MDGALLNKTGIAHDPDLANAYSKMMMDRVAETHGCLCINWHSSWLNFKAYRETFEFLLREAHARNAWGCSAVDLHAHWMNLLSGER